MSRKQYWKNDWGDTLFQLRTYILRASVRDWRTGLVGVV